jgi:hypothetical protein
MPHTIPGHIDYEAHRALARRLRQRARNRFYWRLVGALRSLVAAAIILATFWLLPHD